MDSILVKIGDTLVSLGLSGIFILVLLIGIMALSRVAVFLFKCLMQLQEARTSEIRIIVKAMDDSTATYKDMANLIRQKIGI
jgi:hypothetical protein